MFTFINITNAEAFRDRVASVLVALKGQGLTQDDVRAEFLDSCSNKIFGQDAWERLGRLENPTAAELRLYARVLRVNTTWLITGDVRFVPELMANTCLCWPVPERMWTTHYGAVDPGSTHEFNPDCPVHGPEVAAAGAQSAALLNLVVTRKLPEPSIDLIPVAAGNPDNTEFEF
ncbi:hypothetical protein [Arthrobacter sp. ES1]|uniref:hypothetical protein n=1 Tax=Arthrobacter sp. ES1 TaxID=1897056 RepID=UPI001D000A76|nr:hypothetical protein [Arthrobacter sp. ES1]MCB5280349.1 hypothetical protein [Arthrobacter sp. ES1]